MLIYDGPIASFYDDGLKIPLFTKSKTYNEYEITITNFTLYAGISSDDTADITFRSNKLSEIMVELNQIIDVQITEDSAIIKNNSYRVWYFNKVFQRYYGFPEFIAIGEEICIPWPADLGNLKLHNKILGYITNEKHQQIFGNGDDLLSNPILYFIYNDIKIAKEDLHKAYITS